MNESKELFFVVLLLLEFEDVVDVLDEGELPTVEFLLELVENSS